MELGDLLRQRREELGRGQGDVAGDLGVSQQTVSRWEQGTSVPRPRRVTEIAERLGLDPAELQRLAGHLPAEPLAAGRSNLRTVLAEVRSLTDDDLVVTLDRAWQELKRRLDVRRTG